MSYLLSHRCLETRCLRQGLHSWGGSTRRQGPQGMDCMGSADPAGPDSGRHARPPPGQGPGASRASGFPRPSSPLTASTQTPGLRPHQATGSAGSPPPNIYTHIHTHLPGKEEGEQRLPVVPTWLSGVRPSTASPGSPLAPRGHLVRPSHPPRTLQDRPGAPGSPRRAWAQKPNNGWDSPQAFACVPASCLCDQGRTEPGIRTEAGRSMENKKHLPEKPADL